MQQCRPIHLTFTTPAPRAARRSIQLHVCLGLSRMRVSFADGLFRVPLDVRARFNLLLSCCTVSLRWTRPPPCLLCPSTRPRRALLSSARGMLWPRLSSFLRKVRVIVGVARGPRGFQFVVHFCLVFSGCTHPAPLHF
jgi:hypothetical protein